MTVHYDPRAAEARRKAGERDFVAAMRGKPVNHKPVRAIEYSAIILLAAVALVTGWLVG